MRGGFGGFGDFYVSRDGVEVISLRGKGGYWDEREGACAV